MQRTQCRAAKLLGFLGLAAVLIPLLAVSVARAQVIEFLPGAPSVYESGGALGTNITVIVTRTPATGTSSVSFASFDGSALAFQDYIPTNDILTFLEGESFKIISIPVIDDGVTEFAENFSVSIFNVTNAVLGATTNIVCTIFDNDGQFRFTPIAYTVAEDGSNIIVTVERTGDTSGSASVDYQTVEGSALSSGPNPDFQPVAGTLIFTNGQTTATIAILINDDCLIETNALGQRIETFTVVLNNGIGAGVSVVAGVATVTIQDNDTVAGRFRIVSAVPVPTPNPDSIGFTFASTDPADHIVREGNSTAVRIGVRRECGSNGAVAVDVVNSLGSSCPGGIAAAAGGDFSVSPGTLNWADGQMGPNFDQFITVTITDDNLVELDENLIISLVRPRGGPQNNPPAIGLPSSFSLWIRSDDLPAGSVDPNFNTVTALNPTPGANSEVYVVSVITTSAAGHNGKIYLAGDFTGVDAMVRNRIARIFANGLPDLTFNPGTGADGFVAAIAQQPDGRIVIGGGFTSINNISRVGIARLNEDGTLDNTFNPGSGVHGTVSAIELQSDGSIVIVGQFDAYNDVPARNVARILSDGSLDTGFSVGTGPDAPVWAVALADNSASPKIYIGGDFFSVNGQPRHGLARLNNDGSVDTTFEPPFGADGSVYSLLVQADGAVLVGGAFETFDGVGSRGIVRLLPTAAHDTTFSPGSGIAGAIYDIKLQDDGRIFIAGDFSSYNGTPRTNIARLYVNGTLDTSFLDVHYNWTQPGPNGFLNSLSLQANGGVIGGGSFTVVGGGEDGLNGMLTNAVNPRFNYTRFIGGNNPGDENMPGNVQFVSADYSIDENTLSGTITITVERLNGTVGPLTATFFTTDSTARAGVDFFGTTSAVTWADCTLGTRTFTIPIFDNVFVQGNRTFSITLTNPVNNGVAAPTYPALGARTTATVTIVDNDFNHGVLGFSAPIYSVNETGTNIVINVARTNGSVGNVTVQYSTYDLTATNADYTPRSGTLTFSSGATNQTITIPITDDLLAESEEWFGLRLTNATGGAVLGLSNSIVRILDNEPSSRGSVSFALTDFQVNEISPSATITVRRTSGLNGTLTVQSVAFEFPPANGVARADIDFTPVTNTLIFPPGVTTQSFTVPILSDSFVEGNEVLGLMLYNVTNGAIGLISNAMVTIVDDDAYGRLGFDDVNFFVSERGTNLVVTVHRTDGRSEQVSCDYAAVAISATGDVDFVVTNGTVIFPDGVTSATITIPILNDDFLEGNEQFGLVLNNFLKASPGDFTTAFVTIVDDESLDAPAGSVDTTFEAKPNGFVTALGLQSSGKLVIGGDFTTINTFGFNRIARLNVTGATDPLFKIGTGANGQVLAIGVQPDDKIVIAGRFTTYNSTNRARIARLNSDGTIDSSFDPGAGADNPVFALAFTADRRIVLGGSFTTVNGITRPNVAILNTNGSVDAGFNTGAGLNGTVYALAVQPDGKIIIGGNFTVVNNTNRGRIARLNANGSLDLSFNPGIGADAAVRALALQPDGSVVIGGSFTNINGLVRNYIARLLPNGSVDPSFYADGGGDAPVLALALQPDGKIVAAGDFHLFNGVHRNRLTRLDSNGTTDPTINFGTGANSFVSALLVQSNEQIVIGGGFTEFNGVPRQYVARLLGGANAGAGTFNFLQSVFNISESGTNIAITVLREGGTAGTGTVNFATYDFTATAPPHYGATNGGLVFPPGETLQTFIINVTNNSLIEGDRVLFLSLNTPSAGAQLGFQSDAALVIIEDDASISFFTENYSVNESAAGAHATIWVLRSGATNTAVAVQYATTAQTATDGFDYASTNGLLIFAPGETLRAFTVPVFEDALVEGPETVGLALSFPLVLNSPLSVVSLGAPVTATLTIVDNDFQRGEFTFNVETNYVNEFEAYAIVTVLRTNGSSGIVSVRYGATDGSATGGGVDYQRVNGILSFADGESVKTFSVPIFDDSRVENDETILLSLSNPTGGATMGAFSNQTLVILDDEAGVAFEFASYGAAEDDGVARVTVVRTGNTNFPVSVRLVTGNMSATSPADFAGTNVTLIFAAGQTRLNFDIGLIPDNIVEGTEQFLVRLTNGSFNVELGLVSNAVVNIDDSARFVVFNTGDYFVGEGETNAVITLTRTGLMSRSVSVILTTRDGSAAAPFDYFVTSNLVKFAAFETNRTVLIPIVDDGLAEFPETILLELSFPTNTAIGVPGVAVLTILDNDPGPGGADTTFDAGIGANRFVRALALQEDGRLLVGGAFTNFAGATNRNYFVRLETNGVLDTNFATGTGPNALVSSISVGHDGHIALGGNFTSFNGTNRNRVARIDTNGVVDTTFSQPLVFDAAVNVVAVQSDRRIIAGGGFSAPTRGITRLRVNGTYDLVFDVNGGADSIVHALLQQPDGQILVGGAFTNIGGFYYPRLARVGTNGLVDSTFNTLSITSGIVTSIARTSDGRIVIGGSFRYINGISRSGVARLNWDGTLDLTFDPGTGVGGGTVHTVGVLTNGAVFIGGDFTGVNGVPRGRYALLNADGSLDAEFDSAAGADNTVYVSLIQPDQKIFIGGDFTMVNGVTRRGLARLNVGDLVPTVLGAPALVLGQAGVTFNARVGHAYVFEASTDFQFWTPLGTNTASGTTLTFTDPNAGAYEFRFYRVRRFGP
jgi:uncharacterized delta-60 repeat protein